MPKSPKGPFLGEKDKMVLKLCVTTDVMIIGEFWVQLLGSTALLFNELNFDEFIDGKKRTCTLFAKKPPNHLQPNKITICRFAYDLPYNVTFLYFSQSSYAAGKASPKQPAAHEKPGGSP